MLHHITNQNREVVVASHILYHTLITNRKIDKLRVTSRTLYHTQLHLDGIGSLGRKVFRKEVVSSNNYNHIQENGKDDEQEGDHDEVGLHPVVLPLLPLPLVQVPSFRLRFTLVALVVVALELVHLLKALAHRLLECYLRTPHTTSSSLQYKRHIKILTKIVKKEDVCTFMHYKRRLSSM